VDVSANSFKLFPDFRGHSIGLKKLGDKFKRSKAIPYCRSISEAAYLSGIASEALIESRRALLGILKQRILIQT
jgi:hypothetical protein